ncbi:hypothetical protein NWFMUON74_15040 [Nocardia wallacei]|uniref:Uncharacterized protein n=1 Tax=Nocardia wallacei TaxID=480035 RepID=A0A7G1KEQ0_9NOCA|nr:hypothetical protein NWFMUON74_15040 [Nocardia wallacei]
MSASREDTADRATSTIGTAMNNVITTQAACTPAARHRRLRKGARSIGGSSRVLDSDMLSP